ncbi:MAG: endonuclease domain-containing protein [Thermoflexales bacterium]
MGERPSRPATTGRARALRRRQSTPEARLWQALRNRQLAVFKFRRQHPIGRYIVDFCCESAKLVVEVDGDSHAGAEAEARDASRTAALEGYGYRAIRFTNEDVGKRFEAVLEAIFLECAREA